MKIAVVGAGIFGCVAALKLDQIASVDLFDGQYDIMSRASICNQYRLHSGYHYPRSPETVESSKRGVISFEREFGSCLNPDYNGHYYAIASEGSIITADEYLEFLNDHGLPFEILNVDNATWITNVDLLIKVKERSINYRIFKESIEKKISQSKVKLNLNSQFTLSMSDDYDVVINATYANINYLLPESQRVEYQFELCEKPIVRLNQYFDRVSCVVMDGPFMCFDPYMQGAGNFWNPNYQHAHVMGHVEHAIHHRNIGHFPEIPNDYKPLIDSQVVMRNQITNIDGFKTSARRFFPAMNIDWIGSMFTVRTVLPNRDHDDGRPSYITKHSDRLYSIFSGKIGTCVDIADELVTQLINSNTV